MARILIIDDSQTERQHLSKLLSPHHELVIAHDAEEGMLLARSTSPDVILMDVVLPGLNGFQATRQLSHESGTAQIPIIVVSTKDQPTDQIWAQRQGAKGYLVKPVSKDALFAELASVLG